MKIQSLIPNGLSTLNLIFGFLSIISSIKGNFETAALFIIVGTLADAFDGKIARKVNAVSEMGKLKEIYIFVRPLDVHINRSPVSGIVEKIEPKHGKHKMAFRKSATENEENYITIKSGKNKIIVVQVVGFIARRIRCWVHTFDRIEIGQPIGMLLFSSGTRIIMPAKAKILVKEKQVIKAGETIIAKL